MLLIFKSRFSVQEEEITSLQKWTGGDDIIK